MKFTPLQLAGSGRGGSDAAPHCSVSQAQMIERCPLQWGFAYRERLPRPTEYGEAWKNGVALDAAITKACEGDTAEAYRITQERPEVGRAYVAFMDWHGRNFPGRVLPEAQRRVVTPVPMAGPSDPEAVPVEFFGYLDLLYAVEGLVVDVKWSGSPKPEKLQQWQRQVSSYALGDRRIERAVVLRFGASGLIEEHPVPLDVYDFAEWAARQVRRGPGAAVLVPTPGSHCGWCDFRPACHERLAETFGG